MCGSRTGPGASTATLILPSRSSLKSMLSSSKRIPKDLARREMFGYNRIAGTWSPEVGKETKMNHTSSQLKTFKRSTSLELSTWYMGMLLTNLVEKKDSNGAFSLLEATLTPGK